MTAISGKQGSTRRRAVSYYAMGAVLTVAAVGIISFSPILALPVLAFLLAVFALTLSARSAVRLTSVATMIVLVGVPVTRLEDSGATLKIAIPIALIALGAIAVIKARTFARPSVSVLLGLFLLLSALSTAGHNDLNNWQNYALFGAIAFAGIAQGVAIGATANFMYFRAAFLWISGALAAYGIVETAAHLQPLWRGAVINPNGTSASLMSDIISGAPRAQATLGHPLPLAFILVLAVALTAMPTGGKRSPRVVLLVLLIGGVTATGSRSALLLAVVVLLYTWSRNLGMLRIPALVLVGIGGLWFLASSLSTAADVLFNSGSYSHRLGALESVGRLLTLRDPVDVIFGSGMASTPRLFQLGLLQSDGLQAVDNQYVDLLATVGVVGLILVGLIWIIAMKRAAPFIKFLLVLIAAEGLIFDLLTWPSTGGISWLIIGVGVSASRLSARREASPIRAHPVQ